MGPKSLFANSGFELFGARKWLGVVKGLATRFQTATTYVSEKRIVSSEFIQLSFYPDE
jgi:hypothetical protein